MTKKFKPKKIEEVLNIEKRDLTALLTSSKEKYQSITCDYLCGGGGSCGHSCGRCGDCSCACDCSGYSTYNKKKFSIERYLVYRKE